MGSAQVLMGNFIKYGFQLSIISRFDDSGYIACFVNNDISGANKYLKLTAESVRIGNRNEG